MQVTSKSFISFQLNLLLHLYVLRALREIVWLNRSRCWRYSVCCFRPTSLHNLGDSVLNDNCLMNRCPVSVDNLQKKTENLASRDEIWSLNADLHKWDDTPWKWVRAYLITNLLKSQHGKINVVWGVKVKRGEGRC